MKKILLVLLSVGSINAFAVVFKNPTEEGMPFVGSKKTARFVCKFLGERKSERLEFTTRKISLSDLRDEFPAVNVDVAGRRATIYDGDIRAVGYNGAYTTHLMVAEFFNTNSVKIIDSVTCTD